MIGWLAASRAGHDKDRLYLIVGREGERLLLCDGIYRPVEKPKKKKEKHVQLIKKGVNEDMRRRLLQGDVPGNEEIKLWIKQYTKQMEEAHVEE